jgi:hypothetical protein
LARIVTLGIAHSRSIHIISLFDKGIQIQNLTAHWGDEIRFRDASNLVRKLGDGFEYTMNKVSMLSSLDLEARSGYIINS